VFQELTSTYGVAASRLRAVGVGMAAPVASNATDDGRAKNRRVELVRQ
jgi:outer membrane protein OmpA-like peptidoglycan-associated protein